MAKISKENIDILKDIEQYLYCRNNYDIVDKEHFVVRASEVKDIQALDLYFKLYAIIEELEKENKKG